MNDHNLPTDEDYPAISESYEVFIEFLRGIDAEVSRNHFEQLLFGQITLDSDDLEFDYQPEAYTKSNLVVPLLEALGLDHQPEPKIQGIERDSWPDFRITNLNIPIIGEIKPLNAIGSGVDEIQRYLSSEGCDTPYGILTDGVEWRVYGPPPRGGTGGYQMLRSAVLEETLQTIAHRFEIVRLRGFSEDPRRGVLYPMTDLVRTFQQDRLEHWTLKRLPKEERDRFMDDDFYLEPSLSDFTDFQ